VPAIAIGAIVIPRPGFAFRLDNHLDLSASLLKIIGAMKDDEPGVHTFPGLRQKRSLWTFCMSAGWEISAPCLRFAHPADLRPTKFDRHVLAVTSDNLISVASRENRLKLRESLERLLRPEKPR
jgi:hypothetical protein